MLNEVFLLQVLIFGILSYFVITTNIITLWYLAGLYLMSLGILNLLNDGDIFIGFLWVIDLGVGLIFFIFILHFSSFLHQKNTFYLSNKFIISILFVVFFLFFFFFFFSNSLECYNYDLKKIWILLVNWYDYYNIYNFRIVTDLNIIRELYFYNNSFEFFLINFMLFYGIFSTVNLIFLIKYSFNIMTVSQFKNFKLVFENLSALFIRNQNFIRQQHTSTGTRVWKKKSKNSI